MDLLLDNTHDLDFSAAGVLQLTDGVLQTTAQRLKIKLQTFLGEWFLDQRVGVPYFRDILVKNPDLRLVRNIFRRLILADASVVSVPRLELDWDTAARHLSVNFDAVLIDDTILSLLIGSATSSAARLLTEEGGGLLGEGGEGILL